MQPTDVVATRVDPLSSLRIASPCTADWNAMTGDAKTRFCAQCRLHVHDLSQRSADEARQLLRAAGQGRVCVRFFRRADGTVLTQDCPKGLRRRLRAAWLRAAALCSAVVASLASLGCNREAGTATNGTAPAGSVQGAAPVPPAPAVRMGEATMGDVAAPVPLVPGAAPTAAELGKVGPAARFPR